ERHLGQPGRRITVKDGAELVSVALASQPPESLEDGEVGLPIAIEGHALAPGNPEGGLFGEALEQRVDERRFAQAWFPGHQEHLALAVPGLLHAVIELREFALPPEEMGRGPGREGPRLEAAGRRYPSGRVRPREHNRANEAVPTVCGRCAGIGLAPGVDGLDIGGRRGAILEL